MNVLPLPVRPAAPAAPERAPGPSARPFAEVLRDREHPGRLPSDPARPSGDAHDAAGPVTDTPSGSVAERDADTATDTTDDAGDPSPLVAGEHGPLGRLPGTGDAEHTMAPTARAADAVAAADGSLPGAADAGARPGTAAPSTTAHPHAGDTGTASAGQATTNAVDGPAPQVPGGEQPTADGSPGHVGDRSADRASVATGAQDGVPTSASGGTSAGVASAGPGEARAAAGGTAVRPDPIVPTDPGVAVEGEQPPSVAERSAASDDTAAPRAAAAPTPTPDAATAEGVDALLRVDAARGPVATSRGGGLAASVAARVEAAVAALEHTPPPQDVRIEVDGLVLQVRLRGEVVTVEGDQLPAGWDGELGERLAEQGFALDARSGGRGEGSGEEPGPSRDRTRPTGPERPTTSSVTPTGTDGDADVVRL